MRTATDIRFPTLQAAPTGQASRTAPTPEVSEAAHLRPDPAHSDGSAPGLQPFASAETPADSPANTPLAATEPQTGHSSITPLAASGSQAAAARATAPHAKAAADARPGNAAAPMIPADRTEAAGSPSAPVLPDSTATARTDSLATPRTDSLADSLAAGDVAAADTLSPLEKIYRPLAPEELFGTQSTAVAGTRPLPHEAHPLTGDPLYQLFLLLLVALYIRFIYRHIDDVRLLLARITADAVAREQQAFDDRNNAGFSRFLHATWTLGALFTGIVALRFAEGPLTAPFGPRTALAASLGIGLGFALLSLLQFGALLSAGALTLTQPFVERLVHLRRTHFAAAFLGLIPVLSLYVLAPEPLRAYPLYVAVGVSVIMALFFLKESLGLFLSKKIPILHWFLYLCTVECLPISFIALMLVRR